MERDSVSCPAAEALIQGYSYGNALNMNVWGEQIVTAEGGLSVTTLKAKQACQYTPLRGIFSIDILHRYLLIINIEQF